MAITKKRAVRKKAAPKKKKAAKRSYNRRKQEVVKNNEPELFKVEEGMPVPTRSGNLQMQNAYKLIDGLIPTMKVNVTSFLIANGNTTAVRKYLRETYKDMVFRISPVRPEKKYARVWRVY